ncbi:MAG: hypothetical protein ACTSP1_17730 [Candidatus Freyarchaeota archaeon]
MITILKKFLKGRYIGNRHTSERDIIKGIPVHLVGLAKNSLKDLIREGFVLKKKTGYGVHVSLNLRRIGEIIRMVEAAEQ